MGYTHYFEFQSSRGDAQNIERQYQRALLDCQRVIKSYYRANGGLSGYSAHTKLRAYGGIELNGKGDDAHETFALREHYNQNSFGFCKTARKPYDIVVTACLAILAHRLKGYVTVSSDGTDRDFQLGLNLARKVTKLRISNPIKREELC